MNIHAGVIVGETPCIGAAVIAKFGMVQAFAHEIGKRDGTVRAHSVGEL